MDESPTPDAAPHRDGDESEPAIVRNGDGCGPSSRHPVAGCQHLWKRGNLGAEERDDETREPSRKTTIAEQTEKTVHVAGNQRLLLVSSNLRRTINEISCALQLLVEERPDTERGGQ